MKKIHLLAIITALSAAIGALAQVPSIINYQGRLRGGHGKPFNGLGQFKFALVNGGSNVTHWSNDGSSTGGSEPRQAVQLLVNQGLFSVNLGDTGLSNMTVVIPPSIFTNSDVRLRIWFSDGEAPFQQFYPDQRLTSVGYAMMTASVPDGAITGAKLAQEPWELTP